MNRSLRKGITRVYFQHMDTGHSINTKLCESEIENELAILRFTLVPVNGNQKQDESYLHEEQLESVSLSDETIINGFSAHIDQNPIKVTDYKLELLTLGELLSFEVIPKIDKQGNLQTLHLNVRNG